MLAGRGAAPRPKIGNRPHGAHINQGSAGTFAAWNIGHMAVVKGHQPDTGGTFTEACGQAQDKVTAIWPQANGNGLV